MVDHEKLLTYYKTHIFVSVQVRAASVGEELNSSSEIFDSM